MHNSILQKILQATDIVEVIGERVSLIRKGKDYAGLCPFHPDRKPSMYVSQKKQIFKCFACGAGGDVLKFVQLRERLDFRDALATLARRAGISLSSTPEGERADQLREQIRQAIAWAGAHFQRNLHNTPAGSAALEYALGRGLTRETIARHGLGYAADAWDDLLQSARAARISHEVLHQAGLIATSAGGNTYDRFRQRLMFPICDALGRPVAFGGRALGDDPAKYLNSPESSLFSKSRVLFGLDLARKSIEQRGEAVIVEGYTDAVLLHQFGLTHAVATLGTALTDAHVKLLKRFAEKLILCFDGDQAGMRAADRAVELSVLGGIDVRVAVLDGGMDPADCVLQRGPAGFESVLRAAVDALEFKWSATLTASEAGRRQPRRVAIEALLEFVAGMITAGGVDPLKRGLLVRRLSELLGLPAEAVYQMLAAARKPARRAAAQEVTSLSEASSYEAAVRGLPAGLVATVEELLGMLLADPSCAAWADEHFVAAVSSCAVWGRLYAAIRDLIEEQGGYTRADVIARCDDAEVCELVSRACGRVAGGPTAEALFVSAGSRLASELYMQRLGELQENLHGRREDARSEDRAFGDLLEMARERQEHFVLRAETRLNAGSAR